MKAKITDLRIGNYVFESDCEPHFFRIEQIAKNVGYELWAFYRNGSVRAKEIDPIELNERWLLDFGFKKAGSSVFQKNFGEGEHLFSINFVDGKFSLSHYGTEILYVHQLQNIYFAITGEELSWKPNIESSPKI